MTTAREHFHAGDLDAAIRGAADEVRNDPGGVRQRIFYAELLCIRGDYVRADSHLHTLVTLEPTTAVTVGTWRQLIRAAQHREQVYAEGAAPQTLGAPSARIRAQLDALLALRAGDTARAAAATQALEASRAPYTAVVDGRPVEDVRDLDDLAAGVLEVLAANGGYYWIDFAQIRELELHPVQRPLDLIWRPARLLLDNGSDGEVFVPAIYPTPTEDPQALLGRLTEWVEEQEGLVRGIGQRSWLVGDKAVALAQITALAPTSIPQPRAAAN